MVVLCALVLCHWLAVLGFLGYPEGTMKHVGTLNKLVIHTNYINILLERLKNHTNKEQKQHPSRS